VCFKNLFECCLVPFGQQQCDLFILKLHADETVFLYL